MFNDDGFTSLHNAIYDNDIKAAIELIKAGADLNIQAEYDYTPLHLAALNKRLEIVQALIAAGAQLDYQVNDGSTPLFIAVFRGYIKVTEELVAAGANLNIPNKQGDTPLHRAILKNNIEIIDILIEAKAELNSINNDGKTALHLAAEKGNAEAAKFLVDAGADLTIKDSEGRTPINYNSDLFEKIASSHKFRDNQVNFIVGPHIITDIGHIQQSYEIAGISLGIHGNGVDPVNIKMLSFAKGSRIIINAHGQFSGGKHQLQLDCSSLGYECALDYTSYNFQALAKAAQGNPINVELISCHGGYAINDVAYLPKDSTLMTFIDDQYSAIEDISIEVLIESRKFIQAANQFTRFAAYMATNPGDTRFAINAGDNKIFKSNIDQLQDFSEKGIKDWQKNQITEFSRFLDHTKGYTNEKNQEKINQFQELSDNEPSLTDFVNSFDTRLYRKMLLVNLIYQEKTLSVRNYIKNNQEIDINANLMNKGETALYLASTYGSKEIVRCLLEDSKIELNKAQNNGLTALYIATQDGHKKVVQLLLSDPRTDVNKPSKDGTTPLMIAARQGHKEIVQLLLSDPRTDVNIYREAFTVLFMAAQKGRKEIVQLLLSDPRTEINKAEDGYTALHTAANNGHVEIIQLLLADSRIEINAVDEDNNNALSFATHKGHTEIVQLFIEDPRTDLNQVNSNGVTVMALAAYYSKEKIVESLIKAGANPNIRSRYGTALDLQPKYFTDKAITMLFQEAINDNDSKTIDNLLKYHGKFKDMTIGDSKETLLSYAATKNNQEMITYMCSQGFKSKNHILERVTQIDGIGQTLEKANEFLKKHDPLRIPGVVDAAKISTYLPSINKSPQADVAINGINIPSIHVRDIAENAFSQIALSRVMVHIIAKAAKFIYSFFTETSANSALANHEAKDIDKKLLSLGMCYEGLGDCTRDKMYLKKASATYDKFLVLIPKSNADFKEVTEFRENCKRKTCALDTPSVTSFASLVRSEKAPFSTIKINEVEKKVLHGFKQMKGAESSLKIKGIESRDLEEFCKERLHRSDIIIQKLPMGGFYFKIDSNIVAALNSIKDSKKRPCRKQHINL